MSSFIAGLSDIIADFDLFLLDQFGVLHFGEPAPQSTLDALSYLKVQGKQVIIISNSSKDVAYSAERMTRLGISSNFYDVLITSGEIVRQGILQRSTAPFDKLGQRCLLIARDGDVQGFDDLGLDLTQDPAAADFIIMTNCDYKTRSLDSYDPILAACHAKGLLMLCANPDKIVVEGDKTYYGPGQIATRYEAMGGVVYFIGKPNKPIFEYAVKQGTPVTAARTIMIGDSMGHDIVGGTAMGYATALTQTGAHAAVFKGDNVQAIQELHDQYGVAPTYVMPRFAV